jgi:hypothetical protein
METTVDTEYGVSSLHQLFTALNDGQVISEGSNDTVFPLSVITKSKSHQVTPHYLELRRNGQQLPNLPYVKMYRKTVNRHGKTMSLTDDYFRGTRTLVTKVGILEPVHPECFEEIPSDVYNSLRRKLHQTLLERLKDDKVNLAQAVAERQQTIDMVTGSIKSLIGLISAAKQKDWRKVGALVAGSGFIPKKNKKSLMEAMRRTTVSNARRILAIQYGVRPLLNDVYGACEALANALHRELPKERSVRHRVTETYSETTRINDVALSKTIVAKFAAGFTYSLNTSGAIKTLSELGITNPATIAWELTPWSFVVDWFLPIGAFLSTFDASLGCNFVTGWETLVIESQALESADWTSSSTDIGGQHAASVQYEAEANFFKIIRRPTVDFPGPVLPDFKNPLSLEHFVNALALLTARSKKG